MNKNFWDYIYNNQYSSNNIELSRKIIEYINTFTNDDTILDYGGGSARVSEYIHSIYPKAKIHIYDISPTAINNSYKTLPNSNIITRSDTNFLPKNYYSKIIMHRVLHNMLDEDINFLFSQLSNFTNNNSTLFISVKSKNCNKYTNKLKNNEFTLLDSGFYNKKNNRYIKFYSFIDLISILRQHQIEVKETGEIIEHSFRNKIKNKYLYVYGQYNRAL